MKLCTILMLLLFSSSACVSHHHRLAGDQVILTLKYPDAEKVVLFCSIDGFKPRQATLVSKSWESEVPAGATFRYFYRVDDTVFIPDCLMKEKDDFGFENCIYDPNL